MVLTVRLMLTSVLLLRPRAFVLVRSPLLLLLLLLLIVCRIQESRKQSDDALRYQGEVLDDMARRRTAGKSLAQVWERQRELKLLANRVSGARSASSHVIWAATAAATAAASCCLFFLSPRRYLHRRTHECVLALACADLHFPPMRAF
jgi:hypothetical protein